MDAVDLFAGLGGKLIGNAIHVGKGRGIVAQVAEAIA